MGDRDYISLDCTIEMEIQSYEVNRPLSLKLYLSYETVVFKVDNQATQVPCLKFPVVCILANFIIILIQHYYSKAVRLDN